MSRRQVVAAALLAAERAATVLQVVAPTEGDEGPAVSGSGASAASEYGDIASSGMFVFSAADVTLVPCQGPRHASSGLVADRTGPVIDALESRIEGVR